MPWTRMTLTLEMTFISLFLLISCYRSSLKLSDVMTCIRNRRHTHTVLGRKLQVLPGVCLGWYEVLLLMFDHSHLGHSGLWRKVVAWSQFGVLVKLTTLNCTIFHLIQLLYVIKLVGGPTQCLHTQKCELASHVCYIEDN